MRPGLTTICVAPLAVAVLLAGAGTAAAQMTVGAPSGGFGAPGQPMIGMPPQQQQPPCVANFMPLRAEAQKRADAIRAASARHAPPQEICNLFGHFTEAEAKMVQFIKANSASCGIPAQVLSASEANHGKTVETRNKVCNAAKFGGGERRGPGLGEALGMRTAVPTAESAAASGAFATLSGSALGTPATGTIAGSDATPK
jgi:hypothetical protein